MLLWCVGEIEVAATDDHGVRTGLMGGFATAVVFGPAVACLCRTLCLLWIWVNYALHLAAINLVEHKITDESIDSPLMDPRQALHCANNEKYTPCNPRPKQHALFLPAYAPKWRIFFALGVYSRALLGAYRGRAPLIYSTRGPNRRYTGYDSVAHPVICFSG
jgi:hypothetical protein